LRAISDGASDALRQVPRISLQEWRDDVDRQREYDRGILICAEF
jgi:hypothetical protein